MQQADFEKLLADTLATHGRSPRTQETYTLMLRLFGRYLAEARIDKTLDAIAPEDIEAYPRHLVTKRKVGFSSFNQSTCALRFFYQTCLGKTDWTIARMPYHKKRRVLPEILSPEEIAAIFDACHNLKHKTLLMTSYSGGMRLGETLGLVPSDIDSTRMMIRIEQGKGRKDRYVMLSPTLLEILRTYWKAFRPARWLFKGRRSGEPLSPSTAEKVFTAAAGRAGIRKGVSGLHPRGPDVCERHHEPARPVEREEGGAGQGVDGGIPGRRRRGAPPLRDRQRSTRPRARLAPDRTAGPSRARHRRLSHRAAGRASRSVSGLRLLPRVLQFLPESALSEVPDPQARALGGGAGGPAPAHSLLTDRLHDSERAARVLPPGARGVPDSSLRSRLRDAHRRRRDEAQGHHRVHRRPAHLEPAARIPSAPPLRRTRRGALARRLAVDPHLAAVLPARQGAPDALSRKAPLQDRAGAQRRRDPRRPREGSPLAPAHAEDLERLRQATARRTRARRPLPIPLRPPHRHRQLPDHLLRRRERHLPLPGPRRQEYDQAPHRQRAGLRAALPPARPAPALRPHPALRTTRNQEAQGPRSLPTAARCAASHATGEGRELVRRLRAPLRYQSVAVSRLQDWRARAAACPAADEGLTM